MNALVLVRFEHPSNGNGKAILLWPSLIPRKLFVQTELPSVTLSLGIMTMFVSVICVGRVAVSS